MALFLFLKQIIDIFYKYNVADYCMAVAVVVLILLQLWLNRPDADEKYHLSVRLPDLCIMILMAIIFFNFVRDMLAGGNHQTVYVYGKIGSSLLLYILGRLCYKRIEECSFAIILSSYVVIFSNFINRIINLMSGLITADKPGGDLYYYDTDMAFSIIMSMIFIAILGKNTIIKFITVFAICPYMVFNSTAGVQKILLIVLYIVLFIYMCERAVKKRRYTDYILPVIIMMLMTVMVMVVIPAFTGNTEGKFLAILNENIIGTENLFNRYVAWNGVWVRFKNGGFLELIAGYGIGTEYDIDNAYIAILYSTGIIGLLSSVIFVLSISGATVKINDRKTYYVTIMLAILFLGTCINKNGMEFTQMSWLVMMYFGMGSAMAENDTKIEALEE